MINVRLAWMLEGCVVVVNGFVVVEQVCGMLQCGVGKCSKERSMLLEGLEFETSSALFVRLLLLLYCLALMLFKFLLLLLLLLLLLFMLLFLFLLLVL